jgi:hypothetical protein
LVLGEAVISVSHDDFSICNFRTSIRVLSWIYINLVEL